MENRGTENSSVSAALSLIFCPAAVSRGILKVSSDTSPVLQIIEEESSKTKYFSKKLLNMAQ
jgi:hypothetical protein